MQINKNILITGGSGFTGTNLINYLISIFLTIFEIQYY